MVAGGNFAHTAKVTTTTPFFQTTATPLFQNNETIVNLIYTYNSAPWTITPYFQYTHVPTASSIDISGPPKAKQSSESCAIVALFTFQPE